MEAKEFAVRGMSPDSCTEFGTDGPHELRVSLAPCSLQSSPGPARGAGVDLQFTQAWPPCGAKQVWHWYLETTRAGAGPVKCGVALEIIKGLPEVPQAHGSSGTVWYK